MSSAGPTARARVAERGTLRMSAISPTCSPGPEIEQRLLAARHADLAFEHDEELVALVALADDHVAVLVLADLDGLHHAQQLALGQPREEGHVREHVALERQPLARAPRRPRPPRRRFTTTRRDVVLAAALVRELDERLDARVALRGPAARASSSGVSR